MSMKGQLRKLGRVVSVPQNNEEIDMKRMLVTALLSLGISTIAQGSYYQVECSTADQTLSLSSGHSANQLKALIQAYYPVGDNKEEIIIHDLHELNTKKTSEITVEYTTSNSCDGTIPEGVASSTKYTFTKYEITRTDGLPFKTGIVGLSKDGLTITANMLCRAHFNSMVLCDVPLQ